MQELGHTRSKHARNYLLQTPDTFVRAPLPGMKRSTAIVHISPAAGASFTQYTAEFEAGGMLGPTNAQRFVYVLEGELDVEGQRLGPGDYCYSPPGNTTVVSAVQRSRTAVIEKIYVPSAKSHAPAKFTASESAVTPTLLAGDPWLEVRTLVSDDPSYDFAVNTMTYQPGATLPMVEIHVMEHGMLMLEGGGIYRLGGDWHPVTVGDFIWMGPYCPQWFGALGKTPAKYLIYKNWNRHPLDCANESRNR